MAEGSPSEQIEPEARRIYLQLRELSLAEREYLLAKSCGGDSELQATTVSLLLDDDSYDWLFQPGDLILRGRYEVIRPVGRGGLGEVYLAVLLADEAHRTDAIKILRGGDYEGLARAEREGLRLRDLEHANIPRYRDHGTLPTGQPYLAMEYVHGLPITLFCEKERLSVRERIELLLQVCSAVSFLHQQRILHRDLKPSNVLVTRAGVPKVLDFNISKRLPRDGAAAGQSLTAGRVLPPFTANYASPEQINGRYLGQASDVYSLGVVLYEILTGQVPFELEPFVVEPEKLRQAAGSSVAEVPSVVSAERIDRDLDVITLKALNTEESERYQSVAELARDLKLLLDGRPILAKPPTIRYRVRKFVTRNSLVVGFSIILLAVIGSAGAALYSQYQDTLRERDRAQMISNFMVETFAAAHPEVSGTDLPTAYDLLHAATDRLEYQIIDDPELHADLLSALGRSYVGIGRYREALRLQERELLLRESLGSELRLAETKEALGTALRHLGKSDEAERLFREALRMLEEAGAADSTDYAATLNSLAFTRRYLGHFAEAADLHRQALDLQRRHLPPNDREIAVSLHSIALALRFEKDYEEALRYGLESLRITRGLGSSNMVDLFSSTAEVAVLMRKTGDLAEAERLFREAIALGENLYPEGHPGLATVLNNYGLVALDRGLPNEAEDAFRRSLAMTRSFRSEPHPYDAVTLGNLWLALRDQQNYEAALPFLDEAVKVASLRLPSDHIDLLEYRARRAMHLWEIGQRAKGTRLLEEVARIRKTKVHEDSPLVASDLMNLAFLRFMSGDYHEAERLARDGLNRHMEVFKTDHKVIASDRHKLALILFRLGRFEECIQLEQQALDSNLNRFQPDYWRLDTNRNVLGACLVASGDVEKGTPLLRESAAALTDRLGKDHWQSELAEELVDLAERSQEEL